MKRISKRKNKKLPKKEIYKMISKQTGLRQYQIEQVLDTYHFIIIESLKRGFRVQIPMLGTFDLKDCKGREAGYYINPVTYQKEYYEKQPNYRKPIFNFSKILISEIKEDTRGKVEIDGE